MKEGQGVFTWTNGAKYEGQWKNDCMHGQGTKTFSNGGSYVGEWIEDKK